MANYKDGVGNYKGGSPSSMTKLGSTKLGSAGTSILVDGLSIQLDPNATPTYAYLIIVGNIFGSTNRTDTGKINAGTSHKGNYSKNIAGTVTDATFTSGAIPISGANDHQGGHFLMTLGCGKIGGGARTIQGNWTLGQDTDFGIWGNVGLFTTTSTIFTGFELIGDANFDIDSEIIIYGVKR